MGFDEPAARQGNRLPEAYLMPHVERGCTERNAAGLQDVSPDM